MIGVLVRGSKRWVCKVHGFVKMIAPWSIVVAMIAFVWTLNEAKEERRIRAWQVLTTTADGNSGKSEALEYLNSNSLFGEKQPLVGLDLGREAYSDYGVYLKGVNLSGAILTDTNFRGANLEDANFDGAVLVDVNFASANLTGATNLEQKQLDEACGDGETKLPPGLIVKCCRKERSCRTP